MWNSDPFDECPIETPGSVLKALEFAAWAHATLAKESVQDGDCGGMQTRTDHREQFANQKVPYIVHPMRVVSLLADHGESFMVQRAGACHDLLEDTEIKLDQLVRVIGREATKIVMWVTDHEFPGSREIRSWLKHQKLVKAPREAKAIKLADMVNNTETLGSGKASFWRNCRRGEMVELAEICKMFEIAEGYEPVNESLSSYLCRVIYEADDRYPEKEK